MVNGLPEKLKKCREEYHLTQKTVADKLGFSIGVLADYESGYRTPSLEKLVRLADTYNCSIDYLVGRERDNDQYFINTSQLNPEEKEAISHLVDIIANGRNTTTTNT